MKTVYIACRVGGQVKKNLALAREYYEYAIHKDVAPVMPHLVLANGVLDDKSPEQRSLGMEIGQSILKKCDALWVVVDSRGFSEGMIQEMNVAAAEGIPISIIMAYRLKDEELEFNF